MCHKEHLLAAHWDDELAEFASKRKDWAGVFLHCPLD